MTLVIKSECIDCKDATCTTVCPVDCIYEGERTYYIHPAECIECALCETVCPVDAIRYDDELAPNEVRFARINAEVFLDADGRMTSPGGWHRSDPPLKDHPEVAAWPSSALIKEA
jgi:ferredoxin